ncbi:hypothetical protein [Shimia thalassica]|uniref:hypothetical protein n=1 Tax=Shimia thalassica TaxID=1715693 RepID=UPI00273280E7|nr:hypothetical protein [Shimia thalassica]MDP2520909.1 hypothetical protein [Shimia thalassica]
MIPTPTSFPAQNNHRIGLFLPEQAKDDFDRLEELTADGLKLARATVKPLKKCQHSVERRISANIVELLTSVEKRRLLNDRFREAANGIVECFESQDIDGLDADIIRQVIVDLKKACEISHRVCDLLAAEKDVGWHRGIGSGS